MLMYGFIYFPCLHVQMGGPGRATRSDPRRTPSPPSDTPRHGLAGAPAVWCLTRVAKPTAASCGLSRVAASRVGAELRRAGRGDREKQAQREAQAAGDKNQASHVQSVSHAHGDKGQGTRGAASAGCVGHARDLGEEATGAAQEHVP